MQRDVQGVQKNVAVGLRKKESSIKGHNQDVKCEEIWQESRSQTLENSRQHAQNWLAVKFHTNVKLNPISLSLNKLKQINKKTLFSYPQK